MNIEDLKPGDIVKQPTWSELYRVTRLADNKVWLVKVNNDLLDYTYFSEKQAGWEVVGCSNYRRIVL